MTEKEEIGIPKKSENFSEWYTEVILRSELADYAPIKGCMVFREYSYAIWEKIQEYFNKLLLETGHSNAYFPLFIPESLLKKEAEHFEGFIPECAWITVGGSSELAERLAVRPTSETIIYVMYGRWIRSWRDLPIKLNQWCNIVRWETKATKPFLRTREFLWQEGHTAHATEEEADEEVIDILNMYKDLMEILLAIPVLVGMKTEKEKFAGATYTMTLEALMPDGKALQMGTSHNLGQNFSKPFEIKYVGEDEKEHYVWQTSWGIATRLIGATVMVHGDDRGLVLPPRVATYQIVVVPIYYKGKEEEKVMEKVWKVSSYLKERGLRVHVDERRDRTPGWKFNEWELRGVPLRIEIGPRDVTNNQVVLARRDTLHKIAVEDEALVKEVQETLKNIQEDLFEKAKVFLEENTSKVKTYEEFKELLEKRGGFIKASWCMSKDCEDGIAEETGATIRLFPLEEEEVYSNCIYCRGKAERVVYFAKAY